MHIPVAALSQGWTTIPGGLLTATSHSSSCSTLRATCVWRGHVIVLVFVRIRI